MRRTLISLAIVIFLAFPLLTAQGGDSGVGADAATSGGCEVNFAQMEGVDSELSGDELAGDTDGDGLISEEERQFLEDQEAYDASQQGGEVLEMACDEQAAADGSLNCYCADGTPILCQESGGATTCPACP